MKIKSFFISLIFLLFCIFTTFAEPIEMKTAIYLVNKLIDCPSEEKMTEECVKHNLSFEGQKEDYKIFSYKDGTLIKFKFEEISEKIKFPIIELQVQKKKKDIIKTFESIGFEQHGKEYIKGNSFSNIITFCKLIQDKEGVIKILVSKRLR